MGKKFVEGRGYTKAEWTEVSDSPEITPEEFAQAKPFSKAFPELAEKMRRARGKQVTPTKELVSLRVNRETLAKFRAQGRGWQSKMDEVLSAAAKKL